MRNTRGHQPQPKQIEKKLTRFERALLAVAPKFAAARQLNKLKFLGGKRAYEAIELTRLRRERTDARSADQVNSVAVDKLRYQARSLDENHDLARSILNTAVSNIVGTGLLTFPMVKNRAGALLEPINEQLTKLWLDWSKRPEVTQEHDWQKCQELAARSWLRDGEVFTQRLVGNVPDLVHGSAVAFSIEQIEADFCPLTWNAAADGIRQGIRKSIWGRPTEYFFFKDYPTEGAGDSVFLGLFGAQNFNVNLKDLNEIPAERVSHLKLTDRIRQTRGASLFASIFTRLDDLKEYEESERVAARIGAAFAFQITKELDGAGNLGGSSGEDLFREMELAPGIIADTLNPGEKVESIKNERPDNKITDFRANQMKAAAGGANVGYSESARDFDGSYSSQRQELVSMSRVYKAIRGHFAHVYVQPIWQDFVTMAQLQGLVDLSGADPLTLFDAEHVGLGTPYIEPARETKAANERVQAGFSSKTQEILERGSDPRKITRQIVAERKEDDAKGLVFSSDFAHTAVANADGSDNSSSSAEEDDDADDDDTEDDARYVIGRNYEDEVGNIFKYTADGFRPVKLPASV